MGIWHLSNTTIFKLNTVETYHSSLVRERLKFKDSRKLKDFCPGYTFHPKKKSCWLPFPFTPPCPVNQRVNTLTTLSSIEKIPMLTYPTGQDPELLDFCPKGKGTLKKRTTMLKLSAFLNTTSNHCPRKTTGKHWMDREKSFKTKDWSEQCRFLKGDSQWAGTSG